MSDEFDPEAMIDRVEAHVRQQGYHIVREDPDHATRLAHPRIAKIVPTFVPSLTSSV